MLILLEEAKFYAYQLCKANTKGRERTGANYVFSCHQK